MAKKGTKGEINLQGIFSAISGEFLAAVEQGRILHASHNIRDAGAPLETVVREAFSKLLPSSFSLNHGYLFDTNSVCTPQIDLIISSSQKSQVMLRAPDGATYSPFSDAYAIGEIKASVGDTTKHLKQVSKQIKSVLEMRRSLYQGPSHSHRPPNLISFLIFGDSNGVKLEKIAKQWQEDSDGFPDYVFLLDQGEIIIKPNGLFDFFGDSDPKVSPSEQIAGNELTGWTAGSTDEERRGNALLWLFYAVLDRLRRCEGHGAAHALSKIVQDEERLGYGAKQAADIMSQSADPFAAAMVRSISLSKKRSIL